MNHELSLKEKLALISKKNISDDELQKDDQDFSNKSLSDKNEKIIAAENNNLLIKSNILKSKSKNKKSKKGIIKKILIFFALLLVIICISIYFLIQYVSNQVKDVVTEKELSQINDLNFYEPPLITSIYSDNNTVIGEFYKERRIIIPMSHIPKNIVNAFIAAEDCRFYEHMGFDIVSIIRAFIKNLIAGKIVQGASTITQQVAKKMILSSDRSYLRKIKEIILAYHIEKKFSKNYILYLYLNQIYFGYGAYGIEAAAQNYFNKSANQLNIAQCAAIAGLVQAPSKYNPKDNYKLFKQRQKYVLRRMFELGYISKKEAVSAYKTRLNIYNKPNIFLTQSPYYTEYIRQYIENKYGSDLLYKGGLKVYTALDINMQKKALKELITGLKNIEKRQKHDQKLQGAVLCMEAETGYVKAMIGGRDFNESQFNRAVQSKRQTGSAFKPIIYSAALDKGFTAASIIVDSPVIVENEKLDEDWKPTNYKKKFYGPTRLKKALALSINLVTIKLLEKIGIDYVIEYASKLGIKSEIAHDLSIALGSSGISLIEMVRAYSVFANNGMLVKPIFIKKILDKNGEIIEENKVFKKKVIPETTAYCITNMLESVVKQGTAKRIKALKRPIAGKTGSTNNLTDAWFIGYSPKYAAGVWVGFDEFKSIGKDETGAKAAIPIWMAFMKKVLQNEPVQNFKIPDGIVFEKIDAETGLLAAPDTKNIIMECFSKDNVPEQTSPVANGIIDRKSFFKENL